MPKEIIYPVQVPGSDNPEPWPEVRWSKDRYMQIAVCQADGVPLEPGPEANGWFATLDREGINRLIRALRRARDDAFGKDA